MRMASISLALVLAAGSAAWGDTGNPSFNLVNRSQQAINQVYATPTGVDRWGQDRLQQSFIPPGQRFPVRLPADSACSYDVRVVYADGRAEERRRVDVCRMDVMAFPGGPGDQGSRDQGSRDQGSRDQGPPGTQGGRGQASDPSFRLINSGRSEISEFYATLVGDENWGDDRLGDNTVAVGRTYVIRLPSGRCVYDIKVVFANHETVERRKMDLCALRELRVP